MFYIATVKDGNYGIMDTEDGVLEVYTLDQLEVIKKETGIKIYRHADMLKYVHFVWHFYMNSCEFGSDEFSQVIDYVIGKDKLHMGGSRYDYAKSLKADYLEMKKLGFPLELNEMFNSNDLLIKDLYNLYFQNQKDYERLGNKARCEAVADKWHLRKKEILYYFG